MTGVQTCALPIYVQLLQMIVMPLVFASILSAVARLHNASQLGKISFLTIGTLLFTTLIAALVGVLVTNLFGLTAEGLVQGGAETARLNAIESNYVGKVSDLSVPQLVLSFIPKNPFADLTGANPTSIISVVIFAAFLGVAALKLLKDDAPKGERVLTAIDTLQSWVMKLVRLVMQLTPYGVLALMTKVVAGSNLQDIIKLGSFVVASYLGLLIMFAVHGLLLGINGVSPLKYFRKVWPVLTFAFTSRSSAASIPLNVEAQTRRLGVPESIASFAASFGATIGQNGCAGLYPAMLAVMVAPTGGINPLCLDQAMRDGLITENPARAFHYPKPKKVSANVLTPAEVEDYLDAAERLGHLPMFLLALTAGLRQGELIALKWSDLDVKERTLTITEKRAVERRELVEYEGGTRIVNLTPETVELLCLEHAKHPGSPLMFMHPATQRPYSPQMVRRLHDEIIQEAGLDHIRFADLRHTCAVLSLQNGMDAKEVSQMLGHFRTAMTRQNYAPYLSNTPTKSETRPNKASTEELRQAANVLDHLLNF